MSGPVTPPLEVTEVDGNPSGRPITKIIVSNGDLSISGRTATIDTSGSGGTPGGADTQVQYNNSGAFGGSADFTFTGIGGTEPTLTITNSASDAAAITQKSITFDGGTALPTISTTNGDDGLLLESGQFGTSGPYVLLDVVSSPSNLLLKNAESDGTINIVTDSGAGDITVNANGDLKLYGDSDSVILRHQSGGSVYATSATDEDAILGVTSVGTGTPRLDLQSPSNRVWVLCDANKKMKIQGGSGGNTWVFDASSASGGVTFPDGTEQTTAATGGGWIQSPPPLSDASYDTYDISVAAPFGIAIRDTDSIDDEPCFQPFYSPKTGTLAAITIGVSSAAASACNMLVGLYSSTSAGLPNALIASAAIDLTSTGDIRQTSFTGTPSLTKDTLYYACYCRSTSVAATIRSAKSPYAPGSGPTNSTEDQKTHLELQSSNNTLPATVTESDLQTTNSETPSLLLEW